MHIFCSDNFPISILASFPTIHFRSRFIHFRTRRLEFRPAGRKTRVGAKIALLYLQITSVHFFGNAVGVSRGLSHFCSQMTPSQRPIL